MVVSTSSPISHFPSPTHEGLLHAVQNALHSPSFLFTKGPCAASDHDYDMLWMLQAASKPPHTPPPPPQHDEMDIGPRLTEHVNSFSMSFCPVPALSAPAIAMLTRPTRPGSCVGMCSLAAQLNECCQQPWNATHTTTQLGAPATHLQEPHQVLTHTNSTTNDVFTMRLLVCSLSTIQTLPS
jgi:hypothetical protein